MNPATLSSRAIPRIILLPTSRSARTSHDSTQPQLRRRRAVWPEKRYGSSLAEATQHIEATDGVHWEPSPSTAVHDASQIDESTLNETALPPRRPGAVRRILHELDRMSTPDIYALLRRKAGHESLASPAVAYLVRERGQKPNKEMYASLIRGQSNAISGSSLTLGDLFDEMREQGIQPDSELCHAALEVRIESLSGVDETDGDRCSPSTPTTSCGNR
jgi:hypothetical protein